MRVLRAFCTGCRLCGPLRTPKGGKKLKADKDNQTKKQNIHKAAAGKTVAAKRPARASLRSAKAPLSPRYRRKLHQPLGHCFPAVIHQ